MPGIKPTPRRIPTTPAPGRFPAQVTKIPLKSYRKLRAMVWSGTSRETIRSCFPWVEPGALDAALLRASGELLRPKVRSRILELASEGRPVEEIAAELRVTAGQVQWTLTFWEGPEQ